MVRRTLQLHGWCKARAHHRREHCSSVVSRFPTLPVQRAPDHKTYENISYSFWDFSPMGRHPCAICYHSQLQFLLKGTPRNRLSYWLLPAGDYISLYLLESNSAFPPLLHWLLYHYFVFPFFCTSLAVPFLTILSTSFFTLSPLLVSCLEHLSPFPTYSPLSFSLSFVGFFPTYPFCGTLVNLSPAPCISVFF